ncbi:MAG: signal peptidase I [Verrucomicrobiota bacterium]
MKKLRKQAKEVLHGATKVYHYRKDLIPEGRMRDLDQAVGEVDAFLKDKQADPQAFAAAIDRLDALLRKLGGKIYPKTFWNDNIEVALVAAIIVIGIRTFFFQPFIIPTNSMYPTYSGMNAVVYTDENSPGPAAGLLNKLRLGASHYEVRAPAAGEVRIPIFSQANGSEDRRLRGQGLVRFEVVPGRKWFGLLPAQKREYTFYVDEIPIRIRVPVDFALDDVIRQTYFPDAGNLMQVVVEQHEGARTNVLRERPFLETGADKEPGERIVEFDITLGDALFVDRMTYHFRKPKVGEPFVFRTRDIPGIEGGPGTFVDKYYIKRLAGLGGETLEIRDGVLYADGEPRDEAEAFVRNAEREGEYGGYQNQKLLDEGRKLEIPEGNYVALGDNSGNSLDSRYWGFVPDKAVIGKAVFIYYPFTPRWGLAE